MNNEIFSVGCAILVGAAVCSIVYILTKKKGAPEKESTVPPSGKTTVPETNGESHGFFGELKDFSKGGAEPPAQLEQVSSNILDVYVLKPLETCFYEITNFLISYHPPLLSSSTGFAGGYAVYLYLSSRPGGFGQIIGDKSLAVKDIYKSMHHSRLALTPINTSISLEEMTEKVATALRSYDRRNPTLGALCKEFLQKAAPGGEMIDRYKAMHKLVDIWSFAHFHPAEKIQFLLYALDMPVYKGITRIPLYQYTAVSEAWNIARALESLRYAMPDQQLTDTTSTLLAQARDLYVQHSAAVRAADAAELKIARIILDSPPNFLRHPLEWWEHREATRMAKANSAAAIRGWYARKEALRAGAMVAGAFCLPLVKMTLSWYFSAPVEVLT